MYLLVVPILKLPLKGIHIFLSGVVFLIFPLLLIPVTTQAQELPAIKQYIHNGGYALQKDATTLYSKALKTNFIPASTLKLLTGLAALKILGPDHFFQT
ncbi:MAG: D-alanyl-D-alanine carboxypeptidase, partial [Desulfocapsa sp.]|nr:D-alanyl-D-alanine carboxypeptidase [Desulfocapsa sp.]